MFDIFCRLGLDTQSTISFENFVHHFQDNEVGNINELNNLYTPIKLLTEKTLSWEKAMKRPWPWFMRQRVLFKI